MLTPRDKDGTHERRDNFEVRVPRRLQFGMPIAPPYLSHQIIHCPKVVLINDRHLAWMKEMYQERDCDESVGAAERSVEKFKGFVGSCWKSGHRCRPALLQLGNEVIVCCRDSLFSVMTKLPQERVTNRARRHLRGMTELYLNAIKDVLGELLGVELVAVECE